MYVIEFVLNVFGGWVVCVKLCVWVYLEMCVVDAGHAFIISLSYFHICQRRPNEFVSHCDVYVLVRH